MTVPSITQKIKRTGAGTYSVPSATIAGRRYHVDLLENSCQCSGFRHRKTCAHLRQAVEHRAAKWVQTARALPDVQIDELCCHHEEHGRPEIAAVLLAEIKRRGAEYLAAREQMLKDVFA